MRLHRNIHRHRYIRHFNLEKKGKIDGKIDRLPSAAGGITTQAAFSNLLLEVCPSLSLSPSLSHIILPPAPPYSSARAVSEINCKVQLARIGAGRGRGR